MSLKNKPAKAPKPAAKDPKSLLMGKAAEKKAPALKPAPEPEPESEVQVSIKTSIPEPAEIPERQPVLEVKVTSGLTKLPRRPAGPLFKSAAPPPIPEDVPREQREVSKVRIEERQAKGWQVIPWPEGTSALKRRGDSVLMERERR